MNSDPVALVRAAYDAFARGDVPAVLATFSTDIVWISPTGTPWGGTYHGPTEVGEFFTRLAAGVDAVHLMLDRIEAAGDDRVLAEGHAHYTLGGEQMSVPFAHIMQVDRAAITSFTEYANVAPLLRLLRHV